MDFKISNIPRTQKKNLRFLARTTGRFIESFVTLVAVFRSGYPDRLKFDY